MDRAKRLRGLRVGGSGTTGKGIDTGDDHVVRVADLEGASGTATAKSVLGWAVEAETDTVKSVLAVSRRVGAIVLADLDAELAVADKPATKIRTRCQTLKISRTQSSEQSDWGRSH